MSENLQKLIGVAVMAALVVVGVVVSSGDDTDFTRNRSFSAAPATSASADKAADCCDQNAYEISLLQAKYEDLQNEIALLKGKYEASIGGASPDVQQIADQMDEACPTANPANSWAHFITPGQGAFCVREYLVGFPLELARQVVLTQGQYGFFHRFNADLASQFPMTHEKSYSNAKAAVTEEACQQIFYGYNPPPRFAVFVDTKDGLVLPTDNEFFNTNSANGMIQYLKDTVLIELAYPSDAWSWHHHWPTQVEDKDLCE